MRKSKLKKALHFHQHSGLLCNQLFIFFVAFLFLIAISQHAFIAPAFSMPSSCATSKESIPSDSARSAKSSTIPSLSALCFRLEVSKATGTTPRKIESLRSKARLSDRAQTNEFAIHGTSITVFDHLWLV